MSTPDPGEGYRLVDIENEPPYGTAQLWLPVSKIWAAPQSNRTRYCNAYYRVPIDPAPVPPIPLTEDPCPFFNEPGNPLTESSFTPVVVWIVVALVFATGFLLGWSFGG